MQSNISIAENPNIYDSPYYNTNLYLHLCAYVHQYLSPFINSTIEHKQNMIVEGTYIDA